MHQLSIVEMKALIGGGETHGTGGETTQGNKGGDGGEVGSNNRSTCTAIIQYRHSNTPVFTRVANCGATVKDGGTVLNCFC